MAKRPRDPINGNDIFWLWVALAALAAALAAVYLF
jgi:hypothetical protein